LIMVPRRHDICTGPSTKPPDVPSIRRVVMVTF